MKALGSRHHGRCAALVLIIFCCFYGAMAHAGPSSAQAAYLSASRALMARMAQAGGQMPRMSDRGVARLLATLDHASVVLNVADTANEDVEIRICETSAQLLRSYREAGLGALDAPTESRVLRQMREQLVVANDVKYQDEVAGLLAFDVACAADAVLPASEIIRSSGPFQRQAVASQVWVGLLRMFEQIPTYALDERIRLANRTVVLDAWITYIDALAAGLPPATRVDLARSMDAAAAMSDPTLQWRLKRLGSSLRASGACGDLCAALAAVPEGKPGL